MASAKNEVISGTYAGAMCNIPPGGYYVTIWDRANEYIRVELNKKNVKSYELVDAEQRKSAASGVLRAGAGALFLGPIGLAAGLSAKRKGIYTVAIYFCDGTRSLIEIGEKEYKKLIQDLF